MLIDVISVRVLPGYQLDLEFKNGERRKFDMRPLLLMKPWNRVATPVLFERVRVDYGTVVWPGEIDVVPETLYEDSVILPLTKDNCYETRAKDCLAPAWYIKPDMSDEKS
jgi:hypothetical protein